MNKNRFRTIFSKRLGMLVAVEETATSQGKHPGEGGGAGVAAADVELGVVSIMKALAAALMATGATVSFAQSLPTNGQVAAGQASISQNANTMTINQGTQRTVINWDTFNVGQTHEYFYTERGMKDGKAYVVKSHGWLKQGPGPVTPQTSLAASK